MTNRKRGDRRIEHVLVKPLLVFRIGVALFNLTVLLAVRSIGKYSLTVRFIIAAIDLCSQELEQSLVRILVLDRISRSHKPTALATA